MKRLYNDVLFGVDEHEEKREPSWEQAGGMLATQKDCETGATLTMQPSRFFYGGKSFASSIN
jgi:hypothetical protein